MNRLRQLAFMAAVSMAIASAAVAQPAPPQVGYVYPAGGQRGTTVELTVGGQFFSGASRVVVTGGGVEAKIIELVRPVNQGRANDLRTRLRELARAEKSPTTQREIDEITRTLAVYMSRPLAPALAESLHIHVTIAADAVPGPRELRVWTPNGQSNPRRFMVGRLAEFSETPANAVPEDVPVRLPRPRTLLTPAPPSEINVTLPCTINGQIMPGGVNRYRFAATKGTRLVAVVRARELLPYLADAVPGWFQPSLTLYDASGRELTYADHFRFQPDPAFYYHIDRDGEYLLEIRDTLYRGREDFVYRISVGQLPMVTGVFPLGVRAGSEGKLSLTGWNLPAAEVAFDARRLTPGVYPLNLPDADWACEPPGVAVDDLPEIVEAEPNGSPKHAQTLSMPVIVNGRIGTPGDWDVYRIAGQAGQDVVIEVTARRLGSPLDSLLIVTDASGGQLAVNDDFVDRSAGLLTHHADAYLRLRLPTGGTCFVHVGDTQGRGSNEHAYRLRVSPPRPDFALRIAPSAITARPGVSVPLTVYAIRRDGFAGEIVLSLAQPAGGVLLSGGRIPAGVDQVRITLEPPPRWTGGPIRLQVQGAARIDGNTVTRPAVPAEDMMQAFAYRHLVAADGLQMAVQGRTAPRAVAGVISATPVRIPVGGVGRVRVNLPASSPGGRFQFVLDDPPAGITLEQVVSDRLGSDLVFRAAQADAKAGLKGNLIVNVQQVPNVPTTGPAAGRPQRPRPVGTLPAIAFEVEAAAGSTRAVQPAGPVE